MVRYTGMGSLGGAAYQILLQSKLIITALMIWGIKVGPQACQVLFLLFSKL